MNSNGSKMAGWKLEILEKCDHEVAWCDACDERFMLDELDPGFRCPECGANLESTLDQHVEACDN